MRRLAPLTCEGQGDGSDRPAPEGGERPGSRTGLRGAAGNSRAGDRGASARGPAARPHSRRGRRGTGRCGGSAPASVAGWSGSGNGVGKGRVALGAARPRTRPQTATRGCRAPGLAGHWVPGVGIATMPSLLPRENAGTASVSACATPRLSRPSWPAIRTDSPRPTTGTQIPSSRTARPCSATPPRQRTPCRTPSSSRRQGWTGWTTRSGCEPGCSPWPAASACASCDRRRGRSRRSGHAT